MNSNNIIQYYSGEIEKDRLEQECFRLEGIRSKQIIARYLSDTGLKIIDIGGGAGFYAFWLQSLGHHVSMIDLTPKNIELAAQYAQQNKMALDICETGTATSLRFADNSFDMALLLGPLYHLTQREDRIKALQEAKRVLKPNGLLFASIISKYASLIDGLRMDLIKDDRFEKMLLQDLQTGVHSNDTDNLQYFTTAYFHSPAEITNEIVESGLKFEKLIAIESMGWLSENIDNKLKDEHYMNKLYRIMNLLESNNDLIAVSPHIMAIAKK